MPETFVFLVGTVNGTPMEPLLTVFAVYLFQSSHRQADFPER